MTLAHGPAEVGPDDASRGDPDEDRLSGGGPSRHGSCPDPVPRGRRPDALTWSIIIPTRNRAGSLRATLSAIARLEPPPGGFETIVVDDGGEVNLDFVDRCSGARLVRAGGGGPAMARNAGARAARGDRFAFTDDDCRPTRDWLVRLAGTLERDREALVGGRTVNALRENAFSAASQSLNTFLYGRADEVDASPSFLASNNIALARRGFEEIGGFDPGFPLAAGEDRALCNAWRRAGRRLVYQPEAVVMHHHQLCARRFWRQHFRYGQGAFHLRQREALIEDGQPPTDLPGRLSFTIALLAHPFRDRRTNGTSHPLTQSVLLAGSQMATACGYVVAWLDERRNRPTPAVDAS